METIWIVGCGSFGLLAFQRLSARKPGRVFLLIDPDQERLNLVPLPDGCKKQADGVAFLKDELSPEMDLDWIVPALPVHLAAEWCLARPEAQPLSRVLMPKTLDPLVPNPMPGSTGDLYVSHADFICPDDCPEPATHCTVTQQPRHQDLFLYLSHIQVPGFASLVLTSHQLAPGVGGYRPKELFQLLSLVEQSQEKVLISTACRCHGVMTALEKN